MTISAKIRRVAALTATAITLGLGAFLAAPAQAQSAGPLAPIAGSAAASTHSTTAGAKASAVSPNTLCDYIDSRGNVLGLCSTGTYYDGGNPYRWPVTYLWAYAANRVWFHQNQDGSGWSHCFTGGYVGSVPAAYQNPGNIFISTNTIPC